MGIRPLYFLRRALDAMARGPYVAIVGTATIFVAIFAIGLFAASLGGAQRLLEAWAGEVRIAVYLKPGADLVLAREDASRIAEGRRVTAIPSSAALKRLAESLGDQREDRLVVTLPRLSRATLQRARHIRRNVPESDGLHEQLRGLNASSDASS